MSSGTTSRGNPVPPGMARALLADRLIACAKGAAFAGLALAGAGMLLLLCVVVTLAGIGVGLFLVPGTLLAIRRLANLTRQLAGRLCGVPIAVPYLPEPTADDEDAFWRRLGRLLTDKATWRDLLWLTANSSVGWVIAILPAGLVVLGIFGLFMPAEVGSTTYYAVIHVTSMLTAWLCVPLGACFVVLGLWTAPWLLRAYGGFARWMLAPTREAELALQVRHLAETRTETIDTGAAQIRRIERDLHDGAQARLVAMGMALDAAGRVLEDSPAEAQVLLSEARDASARALADLRDLVRGIHPPVLADRGLAESVRALAMDSALPLHLASDLPGRPPAPVESAAYFAVSELLANVSKHARASQVWIDIRHQRGMLQIGVTDDGLGGADLARGTGLRGLERRLAAFDGTLALSSPPGGPTMVTLEFPCELSSPKTCSC